MVTDAPEAPDTLDAALSEGGFQVVTVSVPDVSGTFHPARHALVLVDASSPAVDGAGICRALRAVSVDVPIIVVTASGDETEAVLALEAGADDCIPAPLRLRELVARVRAAIRRAPVQERLASPALEVGDVQLDPIGFGVTRRGEPVELTRKEFELLYVLMANAGRILTRQLLIDRVWGSDSTEGKTLDTHVRRLRLKLEDDPSAPVRIVTLRGLGYRFERPPPR